MRAFTDRDYYRKITSLVAYLLEVFVYAFLILAYFFVGTHLLNTFLKRIFDNHRIFYSFLALGLIGAQGFGLERLTSGVFLVIRRTQAFISVLRRLFRPHETIIRPRNLPWLLIYRFAGPLFFFNATHFARRVQELLDNAKPPVTFVLINAEAIVDVDTTGTEVLEQLNNTLKNQNITLALCEVKGNFREVVLNMPRLEEFVIYPSMTAALRDLEKEKSKQEQREAIANK